MTRNPSNIKISYDNHEQPGVVTFGSIPIVAMPAAPSSKLNNSILSNFSADSEALSQWLNSNNPSVAKN
jgi:hypothetical protein